MGTAKRITSCIRSLDGLGDARREQYSTLFLLAAASGLRSSELFALRGNDVDFKAGTVRVDESSDQRNNGTIGQGLYPVLKALGLPQGGLHGFRRGCNRRWELAGINLAVIRQQMGHSSHRVTALYSGEVPLDQVRAAFSSKLLEKMENEAAA
jgi:integrase